MKIKFTTCDLENFNVSSMKDHGVVSFSANLEIKEECISEAGVITYCHVEMIGEYQCTTTYAGEIPKLENALEKIGFKPSGYNGTIYCHSFSYGTSEKAALVYLKSSLRECGWFVDLI